MTESRSSYMKHLQQDSQDSIIKPLKMTRVSTLKKGSRKTSSRTKDQHNISVPVISARYLNDTVASTNKKHTATKNHNTTLALEVVDGYGNHQRPSIERNFSDISSTPAPSHRSPSRIGRARLLSSGVGTSAHKGTPAHRTSDERKKKHSIS